MYFAIDDTDYAKYVLAGDSRPAPFEQSCRRGLYRWSLRSLRAAILVVVFAPYSDMRASVMLSV